MSGNVEEDKSEAGKTFPLDLASKLTAVKTIESKSPLVGGQPLRNMRLLHSAAGQTTIGTSTIITTNIVPQVLKQGPTQQQVSGNLIQRPTQITLATSVPVVAQNPPSGTTYHVPRGPAVVANLSAPRSNVATAIRAPMVVTQTTGQAFVRPPRTPSPAPGTAWLTTTNASNGSQIKGAPTVLSPPVRGATVTGIGGKQQIVARAQTVAQNIPNIRPTTATILQSAITIGQGGQIHSFKPGQNTAGIQALGNTVTLAQVLPSRTQTLVYSTGGTSAHFASTPRLTVANTVPGQRQVTGPRPMAQVAATRLAVPVNVPQSGTARLVTPQGTVLTSGGRISAVSTGQQSTVIGSAPARIISTTQTNVSLGRLSVSVASPSQNSNANILTQTRIPTLSLHPLVAVANSSQTRNIQAQGTKVITQPSQGTAIHLAQMPSIKSTQNVPTTTTRTINVQPATLVTQRQGTVVSSQTIPIAKVFPQQGDNQQGISPTASVFIHAPVTSVSRRASPGPTVVTQTTTTVPTTTVASYSIASGAYFYDTTGNYSVARPFNQQQTSFAAITQAAATQQIRPAAVGTQVHGIVANQSMRFNPIMVVEPSRQTFSQEPPATPQEPAHQPVTTSTKIISSPRPSILRKRDHEGSPLKSAKNLQPVLSTLSQPPVSPPSRPDSRGNGHSSGGSTTISATSSPGPGEGNEDSLPHAPVNIKEEEENRPPLEMSPRKKPRKQQLTGNDIDENNDDMQFISESNIKKEEESDGNRSEGQRLESPEARRVPAVRKPASASLLNSYRHTWKTTHNHFLRYSDVRPKDERRPTIMDLANQCRVLEKVNGWKIHHLSTQMLDLAEQGETVYNQLEELLKSTESKGENFDNDINRINELIKGNLQRIKIINEGMIEAKTTIMKIFDHKVHVTDIINRCASKRNFKKREKS